MVAATRTARGPREKIGRASLSLISFDRARLSLSLKRRKQISKTYTIIKCWLLKYDELCLFMLLKIKPSGHNGRYFLVSAHLLTFSDFTNAIMA